MVPWTPKAIPPQSRSTSPTPRLPTTPRRRTILRAAGGLGLIGAVSTVVGVAASGQSSDASNDTGTSSPLRAAATRSALSWVDLTSEVPEGPYYLPDELVRKDIREDQEDFALALTFRVLNSQTCKPVRHAAVEIAWPVAP